MKETWAKDLGIILKHHLPLINEENGVRRRGALSAKALDQLQRAIRIFTGAVNKLQPEDIRLYLAGHADLHHSSTLAPFHESLKELLMVHKEMMPTLSTPERKKDKLMKRVVTFASGKFTITEDLVRYSDVDGNVACFLKGAAKAAMYNADERRLLFTGVRGDEVLSLTVAPLSPTPPSKLARQAMAVIRVAMKD